MTVAPHGVHRDALVVFHILENMRRRGAMSADDAASTMSTIAAAYRQLTAGTIVEETGETAAFAFEAEGARF